MSSKSGDYTYIYVQPPHPDGAWGHFAVHGSLVTMVANGTRAYASDQSFLSTPIVNNNAGLVILPRLPDPELGYYDRLHNTFPRAVFRRRTLEIVQREFHIVENIVLFFDQARRRCVHASTIVFSLLRGRIHKDLRQLLVRMIWQTRHDPETWFTAESAAKKK